jgi:hypothetical protein
MRRWQKVTLTGIAALGILVLGALLIFFSQPVQHRIVARLVDPRPEDVFTIEHARVGLTRTEIRGFNLQRPDIGYRVDYLDADLSVWDIYFRRHVNIGDITATGVEFDYTRFTDVPRPEDPDPLDGLLGELDVPVMLTIGQGMMEGRLLMPGTGEAPLTVAFRIEGGGLAPGAEGDFDLEAFITDPNADGWLRELEARGKIALRQSESGVFERLRSTFQLHVHGQEVPMEELIAEIEMLQTAEGEDYTAALYHAAAGERVQPLLQLDAQFSDADRAFRGDWKTWAERGQVAGFLMVRRLPEFSGEGEGRFIFSTEDKALRVAGRFRALMEELDIVASEMREVGGVTTEIRFDFNRDDEWLRLEELRLEILSNRSGQRVLAASTHQPMRYHRETQRFASAEGEKELLMEILLEGTPIEWAGLFRGDEEADRLIFTGGDVAGRLLLSAQNGGLVAEIPESLEASGINASAAGLTLISDAGWRTEGALSWVDGQIGVRLDPMVFTLKGREVARLSGRFSQIEEIVTLRLQADLPPILSQPGIGPTNLVRGRLEGEFEGHLRGSMRGALIFLEGRARGAEGDLSPVYVDLQMNWTDEGAWRFHLPVVLDREGEPTRIALSGEAWTGTEENRFDLRLKGEHVFIDSLMDLVQAFLPQDREPAPEETYEEPFWSGSRMTLEISVETLQFQQGYSIESLQARAVSTPDSIDLSAEAVVLGSRVSTQALLSFNPEVSRPYQLEGDLQAQMVNTGVLFRAIQGRPPTVEGLFSFGGRFRGDGGFPGELSRRLQGDLQLESEGGVLRLFRTENPLVALGIGLAGLLGGIGGELGTIGEIAGEFAFVPYDTFQAHFSRDENLFYQLRDLTILAPELHISAFGTIEHHEGREFGEQPMNLQVNLGARGELEEILGRAGLLGDQRDALGYRQTRTPFSVEGTPGDLSIDPLFSVILGAVLELAVPIPGRAAQERERAFPPRDEDYGSSPRENRN